jgi:rRNA maturation endonuclease Nob1
MPKQRVTLAIDIDVLNAAKAGGINLSKTLQAALTRSCQHRFQISEKRRFECYRCGEQLKRIPCNICGEATMVYATIEKVSRRKPALHIYNAQNFICAPCLANKVKGLSGR